MIVILNEALEEGVSIGVRSEEPVPGAALGLPADGFGGDLKLLVLGAAPHIRRPKGWEPASPATQA